MSVVEIHADQKRLKAILRMPAGDGGLLFVWECNIDAADQRIYNLLRQLSNLIQEQVDVCVTTTVV